MRRRAVPGRSGGGAGEGGARGARQVDAARFPQLQGGGAVPAAGLAADQRLDGRGRVQVGELHGRSAGDLAGAVGRDRGGVAEGGGGGAGRAVGVTIYILADLLVCCGFRKY